ncbi:unnamed protein product [Sphenostylis stenocarpa]|uniref:Uncharacterized protein n=1 Tax=Sphenostylis stenocarpa TaxID=92480 RepID=A0AA86V9J3_9FABA|nr:unnamed protein product [Sphenostylis stenocarpa]
MCEKVNAYGWCGRGMNLVGVVRAHFGRQQSGISSHLSGQKKPTPRIGNHYVKVNVPRFRKELRKKIENAKGIRSIDNGWLYIESLPS